MMAAQPQLAPCPFCHMPGPHSRTRECVAALREQLGTVEIRNEGLRRQSLAGSQATARLARRRMVGTLVEIDGTPAEIAAVYRVWDQRPCSICGARGWCGHREPQVEVEIIRANERAAARLKGRKRR